MRRGAGAALIVVGLLVGLLPPLLGALGRAAAAEELLQRARPALRPELLAQAAADLDALDDIAAAYDDGIVPALALALGSSPDDVEAAIAADHPDVAAGVALLPAAEARFLPMIEAARLLGADVEAADRIPWRAAVLALVGTGALAAALGAWLGVRPRRLPAAAAFVLAAAIIAGALAVLPAAAAADRALDGADPLMSPAIVSDARRSLAAGVDAAEAADTELIPDVASRLPLIGEPGLRSLLLLGFPVVAGALDEVDEQAARFESLIAALDASLEPYVRVEGVEPLPVVWAVVGAGATIAGAAAAALLAGPGANPSRRRGFVAQ